MKHFIKIILLLCFTISFSFAQDCRSLRIGKFRLDDPEFKLRTVIERTETTQIETDLDTGDTITSTIEWPEDCTYVLTAIKTTDKSEQAQFLIGKRLIVEITGIKNEKILFSCSIEDYNFKGSFFMKRIE
jgi:hypothetical protein